MKINIPKGNKDTSGNKLVVLNIVAIYLIISLLWIILSDKIISFLVKDFVRITLFQMGKEIFFVFMTAIIMYFFAYKNLKTIIGLQTKVAAYEEEYKFVINNTTDGLWYWNIQTNEILLPPKWKKKLGYKVSEIPNCLDAWESLIHSEDFQWVKQFLYDYLNKKIPEYNIEYRMIKKNGEIIWIQDKGYALWDSDGNPMQISGTHTDITLRKNAEEALRQTMEENRQLLTKALEHERQQSEFFSNISHEFKTPLNVILGTVQLMDFYKNTQENIEPKQLEKSTRIMKQNCYRLLRLINNLLDITRLDYNAFNLQYRNCNIIHIIEEISQSSGVLGQNKGITITFDTNVEEKIIACDINIIERIMLNLLSNAIKSTKNGDEICVTVQEQGESILISVRDTGIGIPKDKIENIFDRFMQVDGSLQRRSEGSGIGLSLVKNFVERLKGEISVESEEGVGSEFIIKLPVEVLTEENMEIDCNDYSKQLIEKISVEFSDIYS